MSDELLAAALEAEAAGLSVLPPVEDGSKRPRTRQFTTESLMALLAPVVGKDEARSIATDTLPDGRGATWKHRQYVRAMRDEVERFYRGDVDGLGVVPGAVSNNLEVLDFDDALIYDAFKRRATDDGLADLVERIETGYLERTPGGGAHWLYRCDQIAENTKLASRPGPVDPKTNKPTVRVLIETRGEGGYIVLAPSGGRVHPTRRSYVRGRGSFATIATITPDERDTLHALARGLDDMPPVESFASKRAAKTTVGGTRPGDNFNKRTTWAEILEPSGWAHFRTRGSVDEWCRPGKRAGVSATTNHGGSDLLFVFTSSTDFEPNTGYTKFAAHAILNHAGDFAVAAKTLAAKGYGSPRKTSQTASTPLTYGPVLTPLSSLQPRALRWLWEDRIPLGKLTVITGDPGLGKSLLTLAIAATITQGTPWPDGKLCEIGAVVLVSAEDDAADTVLPRFLAAGGDPKRATMLTAVLERDLDSEEATGSPRPLSLETHLSAIEAALVETDARLLVIDPITAYLGKVDSHTDAEIRGVLMPLAAIAERHNCAILVVMHLNKRSGGPAIYRPSGSIAFVAAARAGHLVTADPDNPERRLFLPMKANLSVAAAGLAYVVESSAIRTDGGDTIPTARVQWQAGTVTTTASQALAAVEQNAGDVSALDDAKAFLCDALKDGPVASKQIQDDARKAGVSSATLNRAKTALGVKASKDGFEGGWRWMPPLSGELPAEDSQKYEDNQLLYREKTGDLPLTWQSSAARSSANGHDPTLAAAAIREYEI
jgi:AAA domain/Bifunctional DNA primase/polymerase, N-terminal